MCLLTFIDSQEKEPSGSRMPPFDAGTPEKETGRALLKGERMMGKATLGTILTGMWGSSSKGPDSREH